MAKWIKTELGFLTYRMRKSLDETRVQFAQRFYVTPITVFNWERGKSSKIQDIHIALLRDLFNQLEIRGQLLPIEAADIRYKREALKEANEQANATTAAG